MRRRTRRCCVARVIDIAGSRIQVGGHKQILARLIMEKREVADSGLWRHLLCDNRRIPQEHFKNAVAGTRFAVIGIRV